MKCNEMPMEVKNYLMWKLNHNCNNMVMFTRDGYAIEAKISDIMEALEKVPTMIEQSNGYKLVRFSYKANAMSDTARFLRALPSKKVRSVPAEYLCGRDFPDWKSCERLFAAWYGGRLESNLRNHSADVRYIDAMGQVHRFEVKGQHAWIDGSHIEDDE